MSFWIDGYEAQLLRGLVSIASTHGASLSALRGRTLAEAWLLWELGGDRWFVDAPVLLDFDGVRLEIDHWNFDALSITWNTVDVARPLLHNEFDGFDLQWRNDACPELSAFRGEALRAVSLLEWAADDMARGMVAVRFEFPGGGFAVTNGLDENQLDFREPDPRYRRVPLDG